MGRVLVPCIQQHRHPSVCLSMMKLYSTQQLLLKARLEPGTDVVAGINFNNRRSHCTVSWRGYFPFHIVR